MGGPVPAARAVPDLPGVRRADLRALIWYHGPGSPPGSAAALPLSTQFDDLFARYGGSIPVAYLRALSYKESGQNPSANVGQAKAQGLLQITPVALAGYNQRYGTDWTISDMQDPDSNVQVATDLLHAIIKSYGNHDDDNLQEDWSNHEFVKLLTQGWNAGYSDGSGVGKVASYLENQGQDVTHDAVVASAATAGGIAYLSDPNRAAWQRAVADLYFQQPDAGVSGGGGGLGTMILAGIALWGVYSLFS